MKRKLNAGFTLIELMIVVAIIGVLAVLAIYGVTKYLRTAKTAEATNSIGAMNRGAVAAYERETAPSELLAGGGTSSAGTHNLCASSAAVPGTVPAATKYQPNPAAATDYNVGSQTAGWPCIRFEMTEPQYYQYQYEQAAAPTLATLATVPAGVGATSWFSEAVGDLDGNTTLSNFMTGGDTATGHAITFTQISIANETE